MINAEILKIKSGRLRNEKYKSLILLSVIFNLI